MSDEQFKEELLQDFILETREHLETVEPGLLEIEEKGDQISGEIVNEVFRAMHSLKSSAGFFGLDKMKTLAHTMENLLMKIRDGELKANQAHIDNLIKGNDILRQMLDDLHNSENIEINEIVTKLEESLTAEVGNESTGSSGDSDSVIDKEKEAEPEVILQAKTEGPPSIEKLKSQGNLFYLIGFADNDEKSGKIQSSDDFTELLASIGTVLHIQKVESGNNLNNFDAANISAQYLIATVLQKDYLAEGLEIKSSHIEAMPFEEVEKLLSKWNNQSDENQLVDPKSGNQDPINNGNGSSRQDTRGNSAKETLRVPVNILNSLMDLAGELVLNRNQLKQLLSSFSLQSKTLTRVAQNIDIITSDMQSMIMHSRLQPIGVLFGKYPRVIRDLSRKLNKDIELTIEGKDVDMDKSIIETLSDPLSHLIRNSADHGIEAPEVRAKLGKSKTGHIRLDAYHKNGMVYIEIRDDGQGINTEILRKKAIEKNLIPLNELEALSHQDMIKLIMAPGFTTKKDISDVSGRGVGMDVVKTNIEKLGGSIEIESVINKYTKIMLKLPLTLAIIPSQIVESSFNCYAIPQINLIELVEVGGQSSKFEVENINGKEILKLRGELLPLVDLNNMLQKNNNNSPGDSLMKRNILILKSGANKFGLIVECLLDSEEIVVKPLSSYIKECKFYSGATILGDGRVAMILDVGGLADAAHLDFKRIQHLEKNVAKKTKKDEDSGSQFILFENGDKNRFAIPLSLISRIDKITDGDIEKIEDRIFTNSGGQLQRLIWLNDFLDTAPPERDSQFLYTIIPKIVPHAIGICATKIIDIISMSESINGSDHKNKAILGSAIIDANPTLFLDIYALYEKASPEIYSKFTTDRIESNKSIMLWEGNSVYRNMIVEYLNDVGISPIIPRSKTDISNELVKHNIDILILSINQSCKNIDLPSPNSTDDTDEKCFQYVALKENEDEFPTTDTRLEKFDDIILKFDKYALQNCLRQLMTSQTLEVK